MSNAKVSVSTISRNRSVITANNLFIFNPPEILEAIYATIQAVIRRTSFYSKAQEIRHA